MFVLFQGRVGPSGLPGYPGPPGAKVSFIIQIYGVLSFEIDLLCILSQTKRLSLDLQHAFKFLSNLGCTCLMDLCGITHLKVVSIK